MADSGSKASASAGGSAASDPSNKSNRNVVWKHIGLHGYSVGTFSCLPEKIEWKSAFTSDNDNDDYGASTSTSKTIPASMLTGAQWTVFGRNGHLRLQTKAGKSNANTPSGLKHEYRFDGFPTQDYDMLAGALLNKYKIALQTHTMSAAGTQYGLTSVVNRNLVFRHCVLDEMNEEGQEFEPRAEDEMMSLDLTEVSQCVLPGNNRNEIELQFPESDAVDAGTDELVAIRFYIPPDPEADPADKEAATAAELLQSKIMQTANIRKTTGDVLVSFDQNKGTFLTPRGRYAIELYDYFLRMRGQKYDYKIKYDDINRLFLLPKPDEVNMAFVIALDKPIRQGQQRYQYLVLQCSKQPDEVAVNLDEDVLEKEYNGELQPLMRGSLSNLIAKTFKVIANKKVFIPGKFANANQQPCVKCAVRANEGLLYPLEKQFVFIHKPPLLVRFSEVESVEFQRYAGGQGSTRNFDLCVNLHPSGPAKEYTFTGIDRSDYAGLYNFLSSKKIPIKNLEGAGLAEEVVESSNKGPVYNEDEIYGGPDDDIPRGEGEEESEDEDYDEAAAEKDEAGGGGEGSGGDDDEDDDLDDEELGSEVDEDLDSDLEEARGTSSKKRPKPDSSASKKKQARKDDDSNDDDDEAEDVDSSPKKKRAKKSGKDPNAPKRAMSAYFFFMNSNRDRLKGKNPDASLTEVSKLLGAEWKKMSAEEKAKYEAMAAKDKERYKSEMKDYVPPKKSNDGDDDGDDDKKGSKKKKKDPNAPKRAMTSFLVFSNEMRPKIKKENPDMSFGELGKKIGTMFRALSAEEKQKYEQLAQQDKDRYNREISNYKSKSASGGAVSSESSKAAKMAKKKPQDDEDDDDGVDDDDDDEEDDDDDD